MISGIVLLVLYGCRDETDSLYRGEDRKGNAGLLHGEVAARLFRNHPGDNGQKRI